MVEFTWQLPRRYLINGDQGKWPFRQLLERYLLGSLSGRSERGFGVPIAPWLWGPLQSWAEDLLDVELLKHDGLFHPAQIRNLWQSHLTGARDWSTTLWAV